MDRVMQVMRCSERLGVVIPARCRTRSGFMDNVIITDISSEGCRIESRGMTLNAGDLVVVRPQPLEGLCGEVRWVGNHTAGVQFADPLDQPVVDHLHRTWATFLTGVSASPAAPLRRAA